MAGHRNAKGPLPPSTRIALDLISFHGERHMPLAELKHDMIECGCSGSDYEQALAALKRRKWASIDDAQLTMTEAGWQVATIGDAAAQTKPKLPKKPARTRLPPQIC